jgi:transketolase
MPLGMADSAEVLWREHLKHSDRFGESAPAAHVAAELGLTPQAICARACALVQAKRSS